MEMPFSLYLKNDYGQGQHRIIICASLVGPPYQVPWSEKILMCFYEPKSHLGHVITDQGHLYKLYSAILRGLHIKFELNWPSGFREEDI